MTDSKIRKLALSSALFCFAIIKWLHPQIAQAVTSPVWTGAIEVLLPGIAPAASKASLQLVASLWAVIKVGLLVLIFELAYFRLFAAPFIGRWAYQSRTRDSIHNYGIVQIHASGFWAGGIQLTYRVNLYKDPQDAVCELRNSGCSSPFSTAKDELMALTGDELLIVYKVAPTQIEDYDARTGILRIGRSSRQQLNGRWESTKLNKGDLSDEAVRTGNLIMLRPKKFIEKFGSS